MGRPGYTAHGRARCCSRARTSPSSRADQRAQRGLFLAMQYPVEIPGVSVVNFLRTAYKSVKGEEINALAFRKHMKEKMNLLGVEDAMVAAVREPGLLRWREEEERDPPARGPRARDRRPRRDRLGPGHRLAEGRWPTGVAQLIGPNLGVLLITHYQRILNYITPDFVHVMIDGRIVKSGGKELAARARGEGLRGRPQGARPRGARGGDVTEGGERAMSVTERASSDAPGRRPDPRPTSRSWSGRSTASRSSTSTPRPPRRSRDR